MIASIELEIFYFFLIQLKFFEYFYFLHEFDLRWND